MLHSTLYKAYCISRKEKQLFRTLPISTKTIDFSSNDFLKLSSHPKLLTRAHEYAIKYGMGATGSRLLSGNKECFQQLEKRIAHDKNSEEALVFCSGYQANSTVLPALLDAKVLKQQPIVFFDKLNHASLYQGVLSSGAELVRYPHLDVEALENAFVKYKNDSRPKFIVSETLYSMDGDVPNLEAFIKLAKKYNAFLYLDEAFATGIFGKQGYGFSTLYDFKEVDYLIMGTFSKALGSCGAYVACSKIVKDYLINNCSGFIYSTALSPMVIGAIYSAWELLPELDEQRALLLKNAENLRIKLKKMGFNTGNSCSHIIPIILGSEEKVLKMKEKLLKKGILTSAVRPPTVPTGTCRLRIILNTGHDQKDINLLIEGLC
ncbi:MAG: aminotransferase class I/II-fold pyridoxal phosphate-dependent enzyme [Chlamydiae bacterium]|nr:aminotransferase class I/II-fold pyridoxal phosphate-dependent enzyme [Chlamydiota bacterium]